MLRVLRLQCCTCCAGTGTHEFHVILDTIGPDGVWVGVAPPDMDPSKCVACMSLEGDGGRATGMRLMGA